MRVRNGIGMCLEVGNEIGNVGILLQSQKLEDITFKSHWETS